MKRAVEPVDELRQLIADAGMSQRAAAEALGKTPRCVEYWLSGEKGVPRIAILAMRRIAEYGVEPR